MAWLLCLTLPMALPAQDVPCLAIGGGRAFVGDAATPNVYVYEGRGLDTINLPLTRRPLRDEDLDALLAERLAAADDPADEPRIRRQWAGYDYPDDYPYYSDLQVDAAGLLWVRSYPAIGETEVEWRVVHPRGESVARVSLPAAFTVTQIGADYILGILTIEGVEVVQQYRLQRESRG